MLWSLILVKVLLSLLHIFLQVCKHLYLVYYLTRTDMCQMGSGSLEGPALTSPTQFFFKPLIYRQYWMNEEELVRTPAVTLYPTFHVHRVPRLPEILNPIRTKQPSSSLAGLSSTAFTQRCTLSHRAFYCSKGTNQEHKDMQADS